MGHDLLSSIAFKKGLPHRQKSIGAWQCHLAGQYERVDGTHDVSVIAVMQLLRCVQHAHAARLACLGNLLVCVPFTYMKSDIGLCDKPASGPMCHEELWVMHHSNSHFARI